MTNLAKYGYCLRHSLIDKPLVLIHVFRTKSLHDYGSHLLVWGWLKDEITAKHGDLFTAEKFTYSELSELKVAVSYFLKELNLDLVRQ